MKELKKLSKKLNVKKDRRNSFSHCFVPKVEIKYLIALIDGKRFFNLTVKNGEACEKIIEMSRNNDCTTGNLLDFASKKMTD